MKDIYPMAHQVLAWLGEEADDSHTVFKHLEEWKDYCEDYKAGRVESRDPVIGRSHVNPPIYEGKTRDAFVKLCQRPWFLCCWAIQEVTLTNHTAMICGADTETFRLLALPGRCGNSNSYHPLHGVDVVSHYSNMTKTQRWTGMTRLIDIIQCSRLCKGSDPRDKVYSLLGMFKRQMIPIDYSLSVADVYRMFTQAIIEETQSLNVLYWMGSQRRRDDLCSWVQDFSVYKPVWVLPEAYVYGSQSSNTNYPTRLLPGFRFEATKFLVKGKYTEAIKDIGSELKANIANVPGSDNFSQTFYGWELLAAKLISQKRFKYAVTDAFLDTLVANNKHWKDKNGNRSEISSQAGNFTTWYQRYGTDVLAEAEAQYFREVEFIRKLSMKNDQKTNDLQKERGIAMFARSTEMACYGRSFFITDQGSMGLAPPMAQPGDEIVWFPGVVYPFIVRRQEDETYKLIGDCFLYAFDISELFDNDLKEIKEYVLD